MYIHLLTQQLSRMWLKCHVACGALGIMGHLHGRLKGKTGRVAASAK